MSAFIVPKRHIDYIVTMADLYTRMSGHLQVFHQDRRHTFNLTTEEDRNRLGSLLWAENHLSVNYRYGEIEPVPTYIHQAVFSPDTVVRSVQTIKACHCLEYQSCEHPEYYESLACATLDAIVRAATRRVPGYDEAEWVIDSTKKLISEEDPVECLNCGSSHMNGTSCR